MNIVAAAFGCLVLLGVFLLFGLIDRVVSGAVGEVRSSFAPAMVGGMRAWAAHPAATGPGHATTPADDRPAADDAGDADGPAALVVPVRPIGAPRRR